MALQLKDLRSKTINGAVVDEEMFHEIKMFGLRIVVDLEKSEYPLLYQGNQRIGDLHQIVWAVFASNDAVRALKTGEVIHHINRKKFDNRISNLGPGTPASHARAHNQSRREKYERRREKNLYGFFRTHSPGEIRNIPVEQYRREKALADDAKLVAESCLPVVIKSADKPPTGPLTSVRSTVKPRALDFMSKNDLRLVADADLEPYLGGLLAELAHLDSGVEIPRQTDPKAWKSRKSRKLGLRLPRMDLSKGERVAVLLRVKHWALAEAEFYLKASSEVGVRPDTLRFLLSSLAARTAISRWVTWRRLPIKLEKKSGRRTR